MGRRPPARCSMALFPATWFTFYPIGMGQVIRRAVADNYRRGVESERLSATDRRGTSLASAGDCQIVWEAINMGLAAGMPSGFEDGASDSGQPGRP